MHPQENLPYQPRTGLASRQALAQQQQQAAMLHQKPMDLFDPNFIKQGESGLGNAPQLSRDQAVVQSIFGAQNSSVPSSRADQMNHASQDPSQMNERDRRIFLRDQERANRNIGAPNSLQSVSYGVAEPVPTQTTQAKIFGDAPPVSSNRINIRRDEVWQQRMMAQRQSSNVGIVPPQPAQGQGFTPSTQINKSVNLPSTMQQQASPSKAHRNFNGMGQSPLRKSSINQNQLDTGVKGYEQPPQQIGPPLQQNKPAGLLDVIGNNEIDQRRRQEIKAVQQNEYNKYLASQQQQYQQIIQPNHARQQSAGVMQPGAEPVGGMQMIGGYQMQKVEDKQRQQREYQQQLNEQMHHKQQQAMDSSMVSEARRKQLSDQVFQELMKNEPAEVQSHFYGNMQPEVPQLHNLEQVVQQSNQSGMPPRVQSAIGSTRRQEVERLQRQSNDADPFHRNRQDANDAKRSEIEKKREYAAMLQAQMAQKKQGRQSSLPVGDQFYEQYQQQQQQPHLPQQNNFYPQQQVVDFSQFGQPDISIPIQAPMSRQPSYTSGGIQPGYNGPPPMLDPRQQYARDQEVSFEPTSGRHGYPGPSSTSPGHAGPHQMVDFRGLVDQAHVDKQQQQRSRQDTYRRQLEDQMKLNEQKKRKIKEEDEKYERNHDKDMAQYMGLDPSQQQRLLQQLGPAGPIGAPPIIHQSWDAAAAAPQVSDRQAPQIGGGFGNNVGVGQPSAIRMNTDITKPGGEIDPIKQQVRLRHQEELKQQMEEARARKEAEKLKFKREDEAIERRLQGEQQRLTQQEVDEIRREGGKAPDIKEVKKVRLDAFQPSGNEAAPRQNNFMEPEQAEQPYMADSNPFMRRDAAEVAQSFQPENFTLQGPSKSVNDPHQNDVFGQQPPMSMLPPGSGPAFGMGNHGGGYQGHPNPGAPQHSENMHPHYYNQMAPPTPQTGPNGSHDVQAAQMVSQSDWMEKQQQQASRIFDDQQKMIAMYQQALEQIMHHRHQAFEQAMEMRENLLKEREQNLENDRLKQQQVAEMSQISALKSQLGNMLDAQQHQAAPMLNPQVANNINQYIVKQKDQIHQMSQSTQNMGQLMREAREQEQRQYQQHAEVERELPVTSQSMQMLPPTMHEPYQINFSPPPEENDHDLQKQVDDLTAQIAANDIDQQNRQLTSADVRRMSSHTPLHQVQQPQQQQHLGEFDRNPQFEQSLNSQSKMVKVPNQNLLAMAAATQAPQVPQDVTPSKAYQQTVPADMLVETWTEISAKKAFEREGIISPQRPMAKHTSFISASGLQSSTDSQQIVTPKRIAGKLLLNRVKSPINVTKSSMPQPIQELPQEEEKPFNNCDGMLMNSMGDFAQQAAEKKSEYDLNNRAFSGTSSPQRQLVTIEAREEMNKIDRIVQQQTQSAWADRRQASMTGTSFYDNHRKTQQLKEQTQQEEMERQLKRILGSSSNTQLPPLIVDNQMDPLRAVQQAYGPDTDRENNARELQQQHSSTVKVRASQDKMIREPFQLKHDGEDDFNQNETNILSPLVMTSFKLNDQTDSQINIAATNQSDNLRQMQAVAQCEVSNDIQSNQDNSLWEDPDLVPVPILHNFTDNSENFEVHHRPQTAARRPELPPSAYGSQQPYYCANNSVSPTDPSIAGLQNMVPDLIRTEEFSVQEINDETTGEQQVLLSSKHSEMKAVTSEFEQQYPQHRFQTYHQSEPITYDVQQSISNYPSQVEERELAPQTGHSLKQKEMAEIEDMLHRLAPVAAVSEKTEQEMALKRHLRATESEKQEQWIKPNLVDQISVPDTPSTGRQSLIGLGAGADKMQTAAPNVASHRLSQMQRAAQEVEPSSANNDQQILTDLDRIIANLEMQQKNMATFGMPALLPEDHSNGENKPSEQQRHITEQQDAEDEDEDGLKTGRSQWTSLSKKRDEHKMRIATPATNNDQDQQWRGRQVSGKAPLDPSKPRPKSTRSVKSRGASTNGGRGVDASPQRIGKYAMLALQQQTGVTEAAASNVSPSYKSNKSKMNGSRIDASPQRIGKFAMMALQQQTGVTAADASNVSPSNKSNKSKINGSRIDASPQRIGKFAMMALQQQTGVTAADASNVSPSNKSNKSKINGSRIDASPQRIGKYAMMALQNSPNVQARNASPSPQPLGRFAQLALQQNNNSQFVKGEEVDNISQKYGRNPSRERFEERSMLSQANESRINQSMLTNTNQASVTQQQQQQPNGPILRPVSGKSNNSRYTATHDQAQNQGAFRQTAGEMTLGTAAAQTAGDQRRNASNFAYYSDDEQEMMAATTIKKLQTEQRGPLRPQWSASGRTEMTAQNKARFNIAEEHDNVNF